MLLMSWTWKWDTVESLLLSTNMMLSTTMLNFCWRISPVRRLSTEWMNKPRGASDPISSLNSSSGDEKPLVIYAVNRCRPQVLVWLDVERAGVYTVRRMRNGDIGARIGSVLATLLCSRRC